MASVSAPAAPLLQHTRHRFHSRRCLPMAAMEMPRFSTLCGRVEHSFAPPGLFADKPSFCMKESSLKITNLATENSDGDFKKMLKLDNKVFKDKAIDGLNPLSKQIPQVKSLAASAISTPTTQVETPPLEKIKTGFLRFKEYFKQEQALFKQLAESQHPMFMIIACADSRVDPCTILGLGLGEAFVVRNVANLVPPYSLKTCSSTASAIEYAVLHLQVKHLLVIGHSRCGGIKALMGMKEDGSDRFSEFIEDWVMVAKGASKKVKGVLRNASFEDQCAFCEKEAVNHSLWNCLSFPFVRERVAAGELSLHGGYYDFVNGSFERWSVDFSNVTGLEKLE